MDSERRHLRMPGDVRLSLDVAAEHLLIEIRRLRSHDDGVAA
jgi:hypothetical protein